MSIPYKKLKNLPEAQNLQDSDITIIEDLDTTRKGTLRQLVQYLTRIRFLTSSTSVLLYTNSLNFIFLSFLT